MSVYIICLCCNLSLRLQLTLTHTPFSFIPHSFCFSHADEYWALEAAMGVSVPKCDPADQEKYNCPSKTQINSWRKNGLLSKVHYFWGHNNLPLPSNDAPQM